REASAGEVKTLLVEGEAGVGRTRFLQELVVVLQLGGALPLVADQNLGARPYGVAERLLLSMFRLLPEQTREAVGEHAMLLSSLSKDLRAELRVTARPSMVHASTETRVRLLGALREVILTLSRDRLLAIVVDDVHAIDEESQALLTSLAHGEPGHRLLLVAALGREGGRELSAALVNLRDRSTRLRLLPLSASETLDLLRSVFGAAPYLSRLAERLYRASEGNPAYCLELAAHLVQTGAAQYREGAWSLPVELSSESLPASRQAAHVARLERLSGEARELARSLSVPHSTAWSTEQCFAVSHLPNERVHELLLELAREEVLRTTEDSHRFLHGDVQAALYRELDAKGRALSHLRLGEQIAGASQRDVLDELRACAHFLRAGDDARAFERQKAVVAYFEGGDMSPLSRAAPLLEEVYKLHRERGHDDYGVVAVLGLLSIAGYFADRSYGVRYGDLAIATLQRVLRLDLARRLTRYLGGKLALIVALIVAGVSLRLRAKRAPNVLQMTRQLMGAAAALSGTAACCLDPDGVARYADVLYPFSVLGKDHAASITYRFAGLALPHLRDRPGRSSVAIQAFIDRLESKQPIQDLPEGVKVNYLAGALFMQGVVKSWHDGPECLQVADKLDQFGPLYAMSADYLRASFHAGQGELARSSQFRERMEVHAVQLGSAWQVETWAPADAIKLALRTQDPGVLKRAVQELVRLSAEIPSLVLAERHARGSYLVLRRKYAQAIPLLESDEPPCSVPGWTRTRGVLARAYNALGKHEHAKEICLAALSFQDPEDLAYTTINLSLQTELALAEAGLRNFAVARVQLDKLLALNEPNHSAITLGAIHHARTQVALAERDFARARTAFAELDTCYRSTGVATLIALLAPLKRELDLAENPRQTGAEHELVRDRVQHVMMRVQLLMSDHGDTEVGDRAHKGLQIALELSSADAGFIVVANHRGAPAAHLGSATPSADLVLWAEQNMLDADVDEQTVMTEEVHSEIDSNYKVVGTMRYCVVPLWARQGREDRVVAALVLGFDNRVPRIPEAAVMRAIAVHLVGKDESRT
ncbi:MAG: multi-sensor signal transduction multi-kinase, partial [Myxococcaceae bacterium]|nr:multi-sensor signal transduction multi-kinase [Myxococcaceae bacterium]